MDRDFRQYHRGDIYFANLDPHYGSKQGGTRPVLIVQNDKQRLRGYAGHLTTEQLRRVNVCLAASLGLENRNDNAVQIPSPRRKNRAQRSIDSSLLHCLCPVCQGKFFDSRQYYILRADRTQKEKDVCTYCQTRMGYDYYVLPYIWEDGPRPKQNEC